MAKRTTQSARSRSRWTISMARDVINAQVDSGLSVPAFAQREGLDVNRLYRWRGRLAGMKATVPQPPGPGFVEVRSAPAASCPSAPIEVVLHGGRVVRVPKSFDADTLRRVVEALEQ